MITKTKSYQTEDGQIFGSIEDAQKHEVEVLFGTADEPITPKLVVDFIFYNRDKIVDILTTKGSSRPKARAVNGGKRTKKPQVVAALKSEAQAA